jgi:bifunctional non-homologous end joining protein LigD
MPTTAPIPRAPRARPRPPRLDDADLRLTLVRGVAITSPDRVLYPSVGVTKAELARTVDVVAELMLPHVAHRPLTIVRCPAGSGKHCFYQRHLGKTPAPAGVEVVDVRFGSNPEPTFVVREAAGLVGLVQMGVLEIHPWGCGADEPERPDRIVFDLDPGPGLSLHDVVVAARDVRDRLAAVGLTSFVKTTGGKGLHVVAPLTGDDDWDDVHAWTRAFAERMSEDAPDKYTANMRKNVRGGRIYVDWGRNGRGATSVAPYSMRARAEATMSMPIPWRLVNDDLDLDAFTVRTGPEHVARRKSDPWADFFAVQQALPAAKTGRTRGKR